MNIFDSVREKIDNFVSQKGKLAAIVIALLVAFFILGVAVMICTPSQKSKKRKPLPDLSTQFTPNQEFEKPEEGSLIEDYYFSRVAKDKWSEEEKDEYFEIPSNKKFQELKDSNNRLVQEILEDTP